MTFLAGFASFAIADTTWIERTDIRSFNEGGGENERGNEKRRE